MAESKKIGRGNRSPARKAYAAGNRDEINRKKRIAKNAARMLSDKTKGLTFERGYKRRMRREQWQRNAPQLSFREYEAQLSMR